MKHHRNELKQSITEKLTAEWNRQSVKGPIPEPEDREAFLVMGILLLVGFVIGYVVRWFTG